MKGELPGLERKKFFFFFLNGGRVAGLCSCFGGSSPSALPG